MGRPIAISTKIGGRVTKTKEINKDGVNLGTIEGYIATWDLDRGDWSGVKDQFMPGAFLDSIARHKETNRPVRLKDMHGRTVGGFPIDTVREDSKGLFGVGEINLDVQQGAEMYSLAKQGVLTDFSIGWQDLDSTIEGKVRTIHKSEIWEGSIVDEPMNPHATVTAVKNIDFSELDALDMRGIEKALTSGIKFSNTTAKKLIHLMKEAGLLRDEQSCKIGQTLDEILTNLKEF
jgi:hypothetical protein